MVGREFPLSLIKYVIAQPEDELYRLLSLLQRKEFLYEQPAFPEVEYIFKHALTQEVAYNSVLQERRKAWHEKTAQAIEDIYSVNLEDHYSDLAHHYSRSGNTQKAVEYLQLAGQQAVQRSANVEAISHLMNALGLLKTLPDTLEHTQQELTLQTILGPALMATKGYGAPEVEHAYTRARELCRQVEETPQLFPVLWGLWLFYLVRGEYETARKLAEQLLDLAQHQHDAALSLQAHYVLGLTLFYLGEIVPARMNLEQASAHYDFQQHHSLAFLYGGLDPGALCFCDMARTLWLLGYTDQALQRSHQARALAQELSRPLSLAFVLFLAAELHQFRREEQAAQERAAATMVLANDQGFPELLTLGTILQGWALAEQGQAEEGITQMRQGLAALQAMGTETERPYYLTLLAEAYGKAGQVEQGLTALAEALDVVGKTGERFYEAELYRLKGELTLQQENQKSKGKNQKSEIPDPKSQILEPQLEAETCFHKAIEIAQRQSAKSLELRAATSLACLWQQQGKKAEAHDLLSEIYNWFTEGFDTKDLQEAQTLLEELS